ncbi:MAG: hypothetical protein ACI976_000358 [Aureispira sp.]|jgi:hypothetical protein
MKLILFVLLVQLLSSFNVYSQTSKLDSFINKNKIKLSETYPSVSGQKYSFTKEQFVYTIKFVRGEIEIYRFDTETNEINKTPPDDVIASKKISILTVAKFGENYMILYLKINNSNDDARIFYSLHYRLIDFETGEISEAVDLDRMKTRSLDQYQYCFSEDNSFLMIYYFLKEGIHSSSSGKIKCIVYQDDFEIFEQGTVKMPFNYAEESVEYIFVTNYATPYVITKNDDIGSHKFLKLKLNKETVVEASPGEDAKWGKIYTYFNTKDRVDLVGSYNKGKQIFIQNLKDYEELTVIDLPKNIYATIANKPHFRDLLLFQTLPCKDGGMLVIMQEYYKKAVREYDENLYVNSGGYYDAIKDYFKNRLLIRFDKDKKIKWIANLPQNNPDYSTEFKYDFIDGQHYFFSLDKGVDKGHLSVPPSADLTEEERAVYTKNKNNAVEIVKLCIVNDQSGQYKLFDLFNTAYQEGRAIEDLKLEHIMITNHTILTEFSQTESNTNQILSLPLKK